MLVERSTRNQLLRASTGDNGMLLVELVALMIVSRACKCCGCAKNTLVDETRDFLDYVAAH
jgi:hypothetical protein